ncbi:MAG: DUF4143 domain-containing protein [Acidimicrobiales bacterium]
MALARSTPNARARWFDDYVNLTLERDVQEISRIRQGDLLPKLLHRLAGQTAQVLNVNGAGRDVGLDHTTAEDYTRLLERVFLIERLPSWGKTLIARTGAKPKLHVVDSGVAARLLRLTPEKLLRLDTTALTELGHEPRASRTSKRRPGAPPAGKMLRIFEAAIGACRRQAEASNDGPRRASTDPSWPICGAKTSTELVHGRSATTQPRRVVLWPQVAFPQDSYSIRRPLIALEITSCWICSVPSKMSMVSRIGPAVSPESVSCRFVSRSPSVPPDSAEF